VAEDIAGLEVGDLQGGALLSVRVLPRSSKDAIVGVRDGRLVVRLTAPPVEGAANLDLTRLLGRTLGVPPSSIRLARGQTGRNKRIEVRGLDSAALRARLARVLAGSIR
jgi:uncharacterized protein (TIGR00251 family)